MIAPAAKRVPTLADRFIARRWAAHERVIETKIALRIQQRVREARRFVFDEAAAASVARVIRAIPELLIREQAFARPPFDLMWLEFPHPPFWNAMVKDRPDEIRKLQDKTADYMVGYLFDQHRVNIVVGGTIDNPMSVPQLMPMQYTLHTEWPLQDQIAMAEQTGTSRAQFDSYFWGTTTLDIDDASLRSLRAHHRLDLLPIDKNRFIAPKRLTDLLYGGAGELRNIIAMLLMLNRPTITQYRNTTPASRGWLKGKIIPYFSHTTVTISLDAVATLRLIGTPAGEAVPRRAHEVRGHFCHDEVARNFLRIAGCLHEWQRCHDDWTPWPDGPHDPIPLRLNHWACKTCAGKRWWRPKHMRGDATRGFVVKDYAVTE